MTPADAHQTIATAAADLLQGRTPRISFLSIPMIKVALAQEKPADTARAVVRLLVHDPEVQPVLLDVMRKAGLV